MVMEGDAISWFSREQKATAAASSESEHGALAGVVNELRFLYQVKVFMMPLVDDIIAIARQRRGHQDGG